MMRIKDLKIFNVYAYRTNYIFIRIDTDEGISGVGECTLEYLKNAVTGALHDLRQDIIGKDPFKIELIFHDLYRDHYWRNGPSLMTAISGIDQALWDIKAKAFGVPVYELIGGKYRDSIPVYANGWSSGALSEKDLCHKARKQVKNGFKALKFSPFTADYMQLSFRELSACLGKVQSVRDAVGDDIKIMIEAHGRFDVTTAVQIAKELEKIKNIAWLEEPIPPDNIRALKRVKKDAGIPLAAGERLFGRRAFIDLIDSDAVDIIQPDISHAGGISEVKKIASFAEAFYIPISCHNPLGPVANAATMQLAACLPNFHILEFMVSDIPYRKELTTEEVILKDGCIILGNKPGLGLELVEDNMGKYPYKPVRFDHYIKTKRPRRSPESTPYYRIKNT